MMINYSLIENPADAITRGLQMGAMVNQSAQQNINAQAQADVQAQLGKDINGLVSNPNASAKDFAAFTLKYPSLSEQTNTAWKNMSEERKTNSVKQSSQVYAALEANRPDIAVNLLKESSMASANAGDEASAKAAETMANLIEMNPSTAKTTIGIQLASMMGADKFTDTFTALQSNERDQQLQAGAIKKAAADLGLTGAQVDKALADADKTNVETKKLMLEIAALEEGDPEITAKAFDMEKKLRDDYIKRTSNLSESQRNMDIINSSAADQSGAGDIALITSFMKMLDPSSVVRETEFATARDTAGLLASLRNAANKAVDGEFLSPVQRSDFLKLAGKYMEASEKEERRVRDSLGIVVKNYNLNPENVFGGEIEPTTKEEGTPSPSYMKYGSGS